MFILRDLLLIDNGSVLCNCTVLIKLCIYDTSTLGKGFATKLEIKKLYKRLAVIVVCVKGNLLATNMRGNTQPPLPRHII